MRRNLQLSARRDLLLAEAPSKRRVTTERGLSRSRPPQMSHHAAARADDFSSAQRYERRQGGPREYRTTSHVRRNGS